jgi:hypothetical protein
MKKPSDGALTPEMIESMVEYANKSFGAPIRTRVDIHDFLELSGYTEKQVLHKNFFKKHRNLKPLVVDDLLIAVIIES